MDCHDAIILYVFSEFILFSNRWLHLVINGEAAEQIQLVVDQLPSLACQPRFSAS